jgi:hypothetical protein
MNAIQLLDKITKDICREPVTLNTKWLDSGDICLEDILGNSAGDHVQMFLNIARKLNQLKGRTIRSVKWIVIGDKDCAIDGTIGFFRIELESA